MCLYTELQNVQNSNSETYMLFSASTMVYMYHHNKVHCLFNTMKNVIVIFVDGNSFQSTGAMV
jgi:hypothetical protein